MVQLACCDTHEYHGTVEHEVTCTNYEPPLTAEELRQLRHLLASVVTQ